MQTLMFNNIAEGKHAGVLSPMIGKSPQATGP
jgi:hypothetical protein